MRYAENSIFACKQDMKIKRDDKKLKASAAKISIREGSAASLMEGFGNRYITPYALALGASNFYIGMLSSLPGLLGNLAQLFSLRLMKKMPRKKIVFFSVLLQAILWLPLIAVGVLYFIYGISSGFAALLLIVFYTLMVIAGSLSGPVWNSWMKDIITENSGEYFGRRSMIIGFVSTIGILIAGLILNYFGKLSFTGFLIIFVIAFAGRSLSAYFLTKQYEPKFKYEKDSYFSFLQFVEKMSFNNFGRFVILVSLVSFATAIAGPFFAVYMLRDLNLSYLQFTFITLSAPLTTLLFVPMWGKFADRFGNVVVLKITGFLVPLVPLYWVFTIFFYSPENVLFVVGYLIVCEAFISGFGWAGFSLAASDFIYDAVTREKMAFCCAYFNIINAFCTFIGALIGGLIASEKMFIFGMKSIIFVFILSFVLRFAVVLIMNPLIKEVRDVKEFKLKKPLERISFEEPFKEIFIFEKIRLRNV